MMKMICLPCKDGMTAEETLVYINPEYLTVLEKGNGVIFLKLISGETYAVKLSLNEVLDRLNTQDWGKS
jgi:uncharacterized protein YlzI (FlbEa/FlbD family)